MALIQGDRVASNRDIEPLQLRSFRRHVALEAGTVLRREDAALERLLGSDFAEREIVRAVARSVGAVNVLDVRSDPRSIDTRSEGFPSAAREPTNVIKPYWTIISILLALTCLVSAFWLTLLGEPRATVLGFLVLFGVGLGGSAAGFLVSTPSTIGGRDRNDQGDTTHLGGNVAHHKRVGTRIAG